MSQNSGAAPHWLARIKSGRLGSAWMVVASLLFGLMGVFVKAGSADFNAIELVFWRTSLGLALLGSVALARRQPVLTPHWRIHVKRGLFGYVSLLLYFYAVTQLSLATAVTLNYTSPLFLALLSVVLLGERLTQRLLLSLLVGFAGVALLLKPAVGGEQWLAGVLGLCSGLMAGMAYLHVRELGRLGEPEWRVVFWFTAISTLGGAGLMLAGPVHLPDWHNIWILLGLGLTATLAQLALTRAYTEGRKFVVASLAYSTVGISALLGWLVFGDALGADAWLALGLIVASGIMASRR